jgi:RNase P subunit RPR2
VNDYIMSDGPISMNEAICPVCGRPMILLHTIRRAFAENLKVFKCKPCGFSTTEPASWTTPPSSQNVSADRRTPEEIQGWAPDDDGSERANNGFVSVSCLVCGLAHFVSPKRARRRAKTARRPILPELTDGVWGGGVAHHGLRCLGEALGPTQSAD